MILILMIQYNSLTSTVLCFYFYFSTRNKTVYNQHSNTRYYPQYSQAERPFVFDWDKIAFLAIVKQRI
jgi:hypothetical protein